MVPCGVITIIRRDSRDICMLLEKKIGHSKIGIHMYICKLEKEKKEGKMVREQEKITKKQATRECKNSYSIEETYA